jgi:hypothetical protein
MPIEGWRLNAKPSRQAAGRQTVKALLVENSDSGLNQQLEIEAGTRLCVRASLAHARRLYH